ncbi:hypothetical protein [Sorangium sp. So ce513]|uniref:hypothetical protein n=1 Tax=Sorangium sp. So ce513 TaxID=3133315 RepID=UPI003F61BED4
MPRSFNTAGPCNPADHYMLPAEERLPAVRDLVDRKACFSCTARGRSARRHRC